MVLGWLDVQMQENKGGPLPHTSIKINSKCIIDLNIRAKAIKPLGEI